MRRQWPRAVAVRARGRRLVREAVDRGRRLERRLPAPVRRFERWLRDPEFVITCSSLAFYGLISIPPMVVIAFWLAGLVLPESRLDALVDLVSRRSPEQVPAGDVVRGLFRLAAGAGPFAVLAAVWPATAYGAALGRAFSGALAVATLAAVWVLVAVIFGLYRLRDASVSDVLLAAAATTALELLISGGYLLYLRLGADFAGRYGTASLATLVLFGLWLLLGPAGLLAGYRLMLRRAVRRREAASCRRDASAKRP